MRKHLINFLYAGNKVFVKYQAQGVEFNPDPPPLRTPLTGRLNIK